MRFSRHYVNYFLGSYLALGAWARTEHPYSILMLNSIMARQQGIQSSGAASSVLESGVLALALEAAAFQYPNRKTVYGGYLKNVLDIVSGGLTDAVHVATRPLDRFSVASSIEVASSAGLAVISTTAQSAYNAINESLALQIRNPDGGLWYYVYPEWSYLDGMFSVLPFMASQPRPNYTDIDLQISLLYERCFQTNSSLLVHGYDWSRTAVWANEETGASPFVWGRSLGWFLAGLVQTWERLDCQNTDGNKGPTCHNIQSITANLSTSLIDYADPLTGAWWQLTTFPNRQGNYLESSSTALFIFSLLKGLRLGILSKTSKPDFKNTALKAYNYTIHNFVTATANDTIGYNQTVAVCSLNSTASYEYYMSQPIVENSLLGESAFILASLEVERRKNCPNFV